MSVGMDVELGMSVAVGCRVAVGASAVAVSFTPGMAVSSARVCAAETSMVGPGAGGLAAHADNKTNKIIASVKFVFMMSPICIVHSLGGHGDAKASSFMEVSISVRVNT